MTGSPREVDSLRADMPWNGYHRQCAPWLTKFAEKSVLYPRSYSISSYTAKSVVPTLVGKYPTEMPHDGYFFTQWAEENLFISERAQRLIGTPPWRGALVFRSVRVRWRPRYSRQRS